MSEDTAGRAAALEDAFDRIFQTTPHVVREQIRERVNGQDKEICIHCKRGVMFGRVVQGEWAHYSGSHYCQDRNGYTAEPLRTAQPTYYGPEDIL